MLGQGTFGTGRGLTRVPAQKTEQNWAERCAQKTEVFGAEPWQRRLARGRGREGRIQGKEQ